MLSYFNDKVVVISGASSGIGYGLAEQIAKTAKAVVMLSHDDEKLSAAMHKLSVDRPKAQLVKAVADIADSQRLQQIAEEVVQKFGAPDIVINNAGYAHYLPFHKMSLAEVVRHADVNYIGALRLTHVFLPGMLAARRGQIVNVASIAGHMLIIPNLVYCGAKHGMVAWAEGLALELAGTGITVQTISPGRTETDFFRHHTFQERLAGKETQMTVPLEKVVAVSLHAIARQKPLTIVPGYWAWVAYALRVAGWLLKPFYNAILRQRLQSLK